MSSPTHLHFAIAKRILRYLQGTMNFGVFYIRGGTSNLVGFTDSDYAGDSDDSKSTSGYVFMLSGGAIAWSSRKQPIGTLSSTEAEFVAAVGCACQAIWFMKVLEEINHKQVNGTMIKCDNTSAIKLSKNPVFHGGTKHMRVRYHFLRDLAKEGVIQLLFCGTQDQLADLMTKPLKFEAFQKLHKELGVCKAPDELIV